MAQSRRVVYTWAIRGYHIMSAVRMHVCAHAHIRQLHGAFGKRVYCIFFMTASSLKSFLSTQRCRLGSSPGPQPFSASAARFLALVAAADCSARRTRRYAFFSCEATEAPIRPKPYPKDPCTKHSIYTWSFKVRLYCNAFEACVCTI